MGGRGGGLVADAPACRTLTSWLCSLFMKERLEALLFKRIHFPRKDDFKPFQSFALIDLLVPVQGPLPASVQRAQCCP